MQQATVAYTAPIGRGLTIDAGIFLSPIGPEGIAVKDQWNWSRSNLFFGLPFYHTGARLTYPFTDRLTVSLQVYNGWNSVVDNNPEKSFAGQLTYNIADRVTYQFLYFTGVERPVGAPEGRAWRHLFDTYLALYPRRWLATLVHFDGGVEPNNFGDSGWAAGALYLRLQPLKWLYLAARGDFFYEWIARDAAGSASPIFWGGAHWIRRRPRPSTCARGTTSRSVSSTATTRPRRRCSSTGRCWSTAPAPSCRTRAARTRSRSARPPGSDARIGRRFDAQALRSPADGRRGGAAEIDGYARRLRGGPS